MNIQAPFAACRGDEPYLFVSYAHRDKNRVYPLIAAWHQAGYRIWYDEGIDPGNEWPDEVARALTNATQFLVFITPRSVESVNVRNEIHFALNKNKSFLAVHLEDTELPDGLALRMGDIQAVMQHRITAADFARKMDGVLDPRLKAGTHPMAAEGPVEDLAASRRRLRRVVWLLPLLVLFLLLPLLQRKNPPPPILDEQSLARRLGEVTAFIYRTEPSWLGAGICLEPGLVVGCHGEVMSIPASVEVMIQPGQGRELVTGRLIFYDLPSGLFALKHEGGAAMTGRLPVQTSEVVLDTWVYVASITTSGQVHYRQGRVLGYRPWQDLRLLEISLAVTPHEGGAAVLDQSGRLLGVVYGADPTGSGHGLVWPVETLLKKLPPRRSL